MFNKACPIFNPHVSQEAAAENTAVFFGFSVQVIIKYNELFSL